MQLNRISARIAPRTPWQAMDMGTHLYRAWWRPLSLTWLGFTLPLVMLALVLTWYGHGGWGLFLLWWLKPVFERPLLEYCAHALFGEPPNQRTLWKQFPRYALRGLLPWLLWRRVYLTRSFAVPIAHLEQQTGDGYRARSQVLNTGSPSRATTLTLLMMHIEMVMSYALTVLLLILMPDQYLLAEVGWSLSSQNQAMLMLLAWYAVLIVIEPLYVCCGFALYLNKRTWLEGWDLELGMRRLGERRRRAMPVAVWLLCLLPLWLLPAAPTEAGTAQQDAIEITASDTFSPIKIEPAWQWRDDHKRIEPDEDEDLELEWLWRLLRWLFDNDAPTSTDSSLPSVTDLLRVLMWCVAITLVVWLLWHLRHWLARLPKFARASSRLPPSIGALNLELHTLPTDPVAAMRAALAQQRTREVLSLLYRMTLVRLAEQQDLYLPPGTTEQEALRHCQQQHADKTGVALLADITPLWISTAWGHRPPQVAQVATLLERWEQHFCAAVEQGVAHA